MAAEGAVWEKWASATQAARWSGGRLFISLPAAAVVYSRPVSLLDFALARATPALHHSDESQFWYVEKMIRGCYFILPVNAPSILFFPSKKAKRRRPRGPKLLSNLKKKEPSKYIWHFEQSTVAICSYFDFCVFFLPNLGYYKVTLFLLIKCNFSKILKNSSFDMCLHSSV